MAEREEIEAPRVDPRRPYALLEAVFARWGDAGRRALLRERATLGLAVDAWSPPLTAGERRTMTSRSARAVALLPNVAVLDNPVAEAWRRALAAASGAGAVRVLTPTAGAPCESIALLDDEAARGGDVVVSTGDLRGDDLLSHVLRSRRGEPEGQGDLSCDAVASAWGDVLRAFDAYAWDAALVGALGCAVERRDAEVALVAGLSAHYLAPHDGRVSACAARWFREALARGGGDALRAHAHYRLTVDAAKHRGDGSAAGLADDAVASASRVAPEEGRGYFLAWAHNARAYVLHRAGDPAAAVAEIDAALGALAGLDADFAAGVEAAVARTADHLRVNRARAAAGRR